MKKTSHHMIVLIVVIMCVVFCISPVCSSQSFSGQMCTASNFKLKDLSGTELALKDFRGRIVILLFGELYQHNTLKAVQDLQKLLAEKRSYREAVDVLLIASESKSPTDYRKVKDGLGISYPILLDLDRNVYTQYDIIAIPTTLIITTTGMTAARLPSYTISFYDQVDTELGFLLGEVSGQELENVMHPQSKPQQPHDEYERLLALAENLQKRGYDDSAFDAYQKVLGIMPANKQALIGIGNVYLHRGDIENASKAFSKVLEASPSDPAGLKGIAQVALLRGNADKAEEIMMKVLESPHSGEDVYYIMGQIYEKQGRSKDAISAYKRNCQMLLRHHDQP